MTIIVEDLEMNIQLDKEAMSSLLGGWKNMPAETSLSHSTRANKKFKLKSSPASTQSFSHGRPRNKAFNL